MKRQLDANSREYHNELERQAEMRYNQRQREKAEEQRLALEARHLVSNSISFTLSFYSMLQGKHSYGEPMQTQIPYVEWW